VRELLRTLPPACAARVLGNRERLAEVMNGGDWRQLPGLRLEAVGKAATSGVADNLGMSNAYKIAKAGGAHAAWMKEQFGLGRRQLESAVSSLEKQLALHRAWLDNPALKVKDWVERDPRYREGLIRKWQQDIKRQSEHVQIVKGVLKEKENGQ